MDVFYSFFYSILGFVLSIGILVVFHELGHFLIARLFNIKIIKFSIGFGPSKLLWKNKLGTEYLISAIPLGGYVQPLDTSNTNVIVPKSEEHLAINNKSPWIRLAVFLAGPLFNLLLSVVLYWFVFLLGISVVLPFIDVPIKDSPADLAKLTSGLRITKIAENSVESWEEVAANLIKKIAAKNSFVPVEAYNVINNSYSTHILDLTSQIDNITKGDVLNNIGLISLKQIDNKISKVSPGYPAFKAGIKPGDIIISIDNILTKDSYAVSNYLKNKSEQQVTIKINRSGTVLNFNLIPVTKKIQGIRSNEGVIGIQYNAKPYPKDYIKTYKYGISEAFLKALEITYKKTLLSISLICSTISGNLSLHNAAGPIAIAYYAGQNIRSGLEYFLSFLGLISINLGVLNLLPIPWLDGGGIVHCCYEILFKKPAPLKLTNVIKTLSMSLLITLSILTIINDIAKL